MAIPTIPVYIYLILPNPQHREAIAHIVSKSQVILFLDTKQKSVDADPEMKWIATWNHYLNQLRLFLRWFHNRFIGDPDKSVGESDWETPETVPIKNKRSKRISDYSDSDIWELEEPKTGIKYKHFKPMAYSTGNDVMFD